MLASLCAACFLCVAPAAAATGRSSLPRRDPLAYGNSCSQIAQAARLHAIALTSTTCPAWHARLEMNTRLSLKLLSDYRPVCHFPCSPKFPLLTRFAGRVQWWCGRSSSHAFDQINSSRPTRSQLTPAKARQTRTHVKNALPCYSHRLHHANTVVVRKGCNVRPCSCKRQFVTPSTVWPRQADLEVIPAYSSCDHNVRRVIG